MTLFDVTILVNAHRGENAGHDRNLSPKGRIGTTATG